MKNAQTAPFRAVRRPFRHVADPSPGTQNINLGSIGLALGVFGLLTAGSARAGSDSVLYSFEGNRDGRNPNEVAVLDGTIYGTTYSGGVGNGTVFKIDSSGAKSVVHKFHGSPDGASPLGGLIASGNLLFGTTAGGGTYSAGTVYQVAPGGARVIYSFTGGADGSVPIGRLLSLHGVLYGTTTRGGITTGACAPDGCGTVFSLTKAGVLSVIYSFQGGTDGNAPNGGLIAANGVLYGTTLQGGDCGNGCGTVFEVTPSGAEQVLYRFSGGLDQGTPNAGLIRLGNTFYGTTMADGTDGGTAFKLTLAGHETVLHEFSGGANGYGPSGGLLNVGGLLYGATEGGGVGASESYGMVYSMTQSGTVTDVYDFAGSPDVARPTGYLVANGRELLGVSQLGGTDNLGTVFSVSP